MTTTQVERIEQGTDPLFFREHLLRYAFAEERLRPGPLLDMACGTGYGTDRFARLDGLLAVGVDLDAASVFEARRAYPHPATRFSIASGTALPFRNGAFRTIVSLETIEHIPDDRAYLAELVRVLAADGVCFISTPNRLYSESQRISNPFHVREYVADELRQLLAAHFGRVSIYYQGFTERYHREVASYSQEVGARKGTLPLPLRLAVKTVYQPLGDVVPVPVKNYLIRRFLRLEFPQPNESDPVILPTPMQSVRNFLAVCEQPGG